MEGVPTGFNIILGAAIISWVFFAAMGMRVRENIPFFLGLCTILALLTFGFWLLVLS